MSMCMWARVRFCLCECMRMCQLSCAGVCHVLLIVYLYLFFIQVESPSSNGVSNARAMAKIGALIANGGEHDGVRVLFIFCAKLQCII